MIIITIQMDIPFEKNKEFIQTLLVILEPIRTGCACISIEFLKDLGVENRYSLIGKWENESDLQNHLESEEFSILRGAMSLLQGPPEVNLYVESSQKGIKDLHKISDRQKTNNLNT